MRTLYITTARFRLKPEEQQAQPMAGGLLSIETDATGLREPCFG